MSKQGFAFKPVTAQQLERALRSRRKHAMRWVTLVRSTRTGETYLWDVEDKCEIPPEAFIRKR